MDKVLKRLKASVNHLHAVDEFFAANDPEYLSFREKLNALGEAYESFSTSMYYGGYGRQMILGDLLAYILMSRGSLWGYKKKNRSNYIKIILYTINQLLQQEHVTWFQDIRKKFQENMEKEKIDFFIEDSEYAKFYKKCKAYQKPLSYKGETKPLYFAVDSLLPKSVGSVIELVVYLYLIRHDFGHVIPLQLHQRLLSNNGHIIAPNFLIIKNKKIYGIEVKQARGAVPSHIFSFMSETSIPVIVATIPNTVPLRCYECNKWILYCGHIIERFSDMSEEIREIKVSCVDCEQFEDCKNIIYYGPLDSEKKEYHYHYACVKNKRLVKRILKDEKERKKRLIAYFPFVQGLSRLR